MYIALYWVLPATLMAYYKRQDSARNAPYKNPIGTL